MTRYIAEPANVPQPAKIGILLINLGTPQAPTAAALRPYLRQFLSDPRVVEIPKPVWWLILNAFILPFRPKASAEKYASIWNKDGSPLLVNAQKQAAKLQGFLSDTLKTPYVVKLAMRYGKPDVETALQELKQAGCNRILLFPLYPQYAGSSSASALDAVWRTLLQTRNIPEIRTIRSYPDHPAYIAALVQSVRDYWRYSGRGEKLVMSFHGVPKFTVDKGDPYYAECQRTAAKLREALGLSEAQAPMYFQSRFGKAEWLQPYFAPAMEQLGKQKLARIDVICPGFSSDCLETLEEIAVEGKQLFQSNGGGEYHYIPALNDRDDWIIAMKQLVLENIKGWH